MHTKKREHTDIDGKFFNLQRKDYVELIFFPIIIILFVIFEFRIKQQITDEHLAKKLEFVVLPILLGLLHILASNVLSVMYNMQRVVTPFLKPPLATPKRLKIIGAALLAVGMFTLFTI